MQQNPFKQIETPSVTSPAVESVSTPAVEVETISTASLPDPVEAYLDQVMTPLQEIRRELRGHLQDIVAAHIEMGATPEEAFERARRQFGRSDAITRLYVNKWKLLLDKGLLKQARKTALVCVGGEVLLTAILLNQTRERINFDNSIMFTVILFFPLFTGFLIAHFTHGKAIRASCEAHFLLSPALLLCYEGWAHMQNFSDKAGAGFTFFAAQFIGSLLFGSLGAWVGARFRGKWQEIRLLLAR